MHEEVPREAQSCTLLEMGTFPFLASVRFQPAQGFFAGFSLLPRVVYQWSILAYLRDSLSAVIVHRLENGPSTQSPISTHAPPPSPHHQHATTPPLFKETNDGIASHTLPVLCGPHLHGKRKGGIAGHEVPWRPRCATFARLRSLRSLHWQCCGVAALSVGSVYSVAPLSWQGSSAFSVVLKSSCLLFLVYSV